VIELVTLNQLLMSVWMQLEECLKTREEMDLLLPGFSSEGLNKTAVNRTKCGAVERESRPSTG
jgi:hypothetical protein